MSFRFDGVDDNLRADGMGTGTTYSVAMWFQADKGDVIICDFSHSAGYRRSRLAYTPDGRFDFVGWANNQTYYEWTSPIEPDPNGWKFVCISYQSQPFINITPTLWAFNPSGGGLRQPGWIYGGGPIDDATPTADGGYFHVGCDVAGAYRFQGLIGEIMVWPNTFFITPEVAAICELGAYTRPESLLLYWPCDNGSFQALAANVPMVYTGVVAGPNPPIRPAGRRG